MFYVCKVSLFLIFWSLMGGGWLERFHCSTYCSVFHKLCFLIEVHCCVSDIRNNTKMYPWTKRSTLKVKDRFPGFSICCYRGRAQTVFFGMILTVMLLILYRIAASETESPKVTRDNKKLLVLEKMKKRTMENINEVMEMTQSSEHLAWQKEFEGRIISSSMKGSFGSHGVVGSFNRIKGN